MTAGLPTFFRSDKLVTALPIRIMIRAICRSSEDTEYLRDPADQKTQVPVRMPVASIPIILGIR